VSDRQHAALVGMLAAACALAAVVYVFGLWLRS
jgi:hypothetical protein